MDRWAPGRVMVNAYGPTETTMCVAVSAPLARVRGPADRLAGGCAALFVLDRWLRPVPPGWWASCTWPAADWHTAMCAGTR
ncbi:AMP-binding enzyme family protein [Mycobacterium xenopi 4042]|uniref:AMP-binding enzyme family protein n=1 Tax=Mycobacterium xenopi 4042 TaxID=1299334 RepID=X8APH2_MYCXE|nr:AMP-binding enzyme family protein [Mycobacterium xenopi 4042]